MHEGEQAQRQALPSLQGKLKSPNYTCLGYEAWVWSVTWGLFDLTASVWLRKWNWIFSSWNLLIWSLGTSLFFLESTLTSGVWPALQVQDQIALLFSFVYIRVLPLSLYWGKIGEINFMDRWLETGTGYYHGIVVLYAVHVDSVSCHPLLLFWCPSPSGFSIASWLGVLKERCVFFFLDICKKPPQLQKNRHGFWRKSDFLCGGMYASQKRN